MPKHIKDARVNQLGEEVPTKKDLFKNTTLGPIGLSGPALDAKFRKPFPNMGPTRTGRER